MIYILKYEVNKKNIYIYILVYIIPKQSVVIIIPSLYLTAKTEVPVTIGCLFV